ncbi:class I SAM-dependent methyltransferase [Humibacillus xanthopallidus]|uniref:Methyltransferase family protein n=1 Tax=Humibacillus xanthopallidus TaxID=412689 RepID=A0A543I368_9MICO|nr:class I SAM-dependent methyltransferase [Humibacillus xanthopallidus]TQM64920.1 methyltransferase family protein [Humibacillus xanthopallidus]
MGDGSCWRAGALACWRVEDSYAAGVPHGSWIADTSESYDRVAARYSDLVRSGLDDLPLASDLVDHFARRVVSAGGGLVLDVGCGPGWLSRRLASRGLTVSGIDISTEMLRLARASNPGLPFACASVTHLPLADGVAAGVFCWYVLHHVPDDCLANAVQELARVTAPGGFLLLGGHVGDSSHLKTEGYGGLPMRVLIARRSPESYARLLREAGLTVDATVELGPDQPASGAVLLAHKPDAHSTAL